MLNASVTSENQFHCTRRYLQLYELDWACGQLRYLQGKGGSSCSTKLCTAAVEICTTVLLLLSLCFSKVMICLWVSVNKSTSSAVAHWRLQTKSDLYILSSCWNGVGRRTAAGGVFFFGGLPPRLRENFWRGVDCGKMEIGVLSLYGTDYYFEAEVPY